MKLHQLTLIIAIYSSTLSAQFKPGYYYAADGTKTSGLIKQNKSDAIQFKETKKANKQKLTADEIVSFVVEKDSFALIGEFATRYNTSYDRAFAKVALITGNGIIYQFDEMVSYPQQNMPSWEAAVYLVASNGKLEELNKKNFITIMSVVLRTDPELLGEIEAKKLKLDDMPVIIQRHAEIRK